MKDRDQIAQVISRVSEDPAARKQLAAALASGSPEQIQQVAAQFGVELSAERAAQIAGRPSGSPQDIAATSQLALT